MTLAIGAKYPWGELNNLFVPPAKPPSAIILASDSRWTYNSPESYKDIGTKLFDISKHVGFVYAGESQVAEECLAELKRQLVRHKRPGSQPGRELAQETFRGVYKTYLAKKGLSSDECPLYILIGACNTLGEVELCRFKYCDDFVAKPVEDICAIGVQNVAQQFPKLLESELKRQVEKEKSLRRRWPTIPIADLGPVPIKVDPHHVAMVIAGLLHNIIESELDKKVGGKVQCAVITAEGFSLLRISSTTDPTNEGPGFTRLTPKPHELSTVTGIFGCYDLSD